MKKLVLSLGLLAIVVTITLCWNNTPKAPRLPEEIVFPEAQKDSPDTWASLQRLWPIGEYDKKAYKKALASAKEFRSAKSDYSWEACGPYNIGGRIADIEVDPNNENIIYVGAAHSGLLRLNNGLSSDWENLFYDVPNTSVGDIAIDPNNSDIIYVGTGEPTCASLTTIGNGMYKSDDGGATWQQKGLENTDLIHRVIVDYNDSERIFVAAGGDIFSATPDRGVYRSENGGDSWEQVLYVTDSTAACELIQHPTNPDILYAAMWERMRGLHYRNSFGKTTGIYKTVDGGDTWTELAGGLPENVNAGRAGIAIAQNNPEILYALFDMPNEQVSVFKTDNGGASWEEKPSYSLDGMNASFGWYFGQIRVDPTDDNRVYVLGVEMWRSDNGGNNWIELSSYSVGDIHVDHHAMTFMENGDVLEGNDGGLYFSDDHGFNWTKYNHLPITEAYIIDVSRTDPSHIILGAQDNGTWRTNGNPDEYNHILGGDGMYCRLEYDNDNEAYGEYQNGGLVHFSSYYNMDYINYPSSIDERVNWSAPIELDPDNSDIIYFGTYRVWKSINEGSTWTAISDDLTSGIDNSFYTVSTIGVSPINNEIIIAGTTDGHVHVTTDGGTTWNNISDGLPERWVTRVIGDPFDENTLYVTMSGLRWSEEISRVFMSDDLGETWQNISGDLPGLPVQVVVADPDAEGRLFVGLDAGVFFTEDYGETWYSLNDGLVNAPVYDIRLHQESRQLFISLYGYSIWKMDLSMLPVGVEETATNTNAKALTIYPNPVKRGVAPVLTINSEYTSTATISIFTMEGAVLQQAKDFSLSKGKNSISLAPINAAGTYIVQLKSNSKTESKKLIIN